VLPCVAVCCSACCSAVQENTIQLTHKHSRTRIKFAIHAHQQTHSWYIEKQHTATHCNTLQHTAIHCNTLLHTAKRCNTLQHTVGISRNKSFMSHICMSHVTRNKFAIQLTHKHLFLVLPSVVVMTVFVQRERRAIHPR